MLLDKVKIAETLKPNSVDPVTLEDVKPDAVTWTWNGVEYRGACGEQDRVRKVAREVRGGAEEGALRP